MRSRNSSTRGRAVGAGALAVSAAALAVALALPGAFSLDGGGAAALTVTWHADDLGFNVTSAKGLSNIVVEFCDGSTHKHEFQGAEVRNSSHRETQVIVGVWVKSGNDGDDAGPPGAGVRVENQGVDCGATPPPTPPPPPPPPPVTSCDGPRDLGARASEGPQNVVAWSAVGNATAYRVYRAEGGGFELLATVHRAQTSHVDDNVTAHAAYRYRVTAMVGGQETEACNEASVVAIPELPTLLAGGLATMAGLGAYALRRRRA